MKLIKARSIFTGAGLTLLLACAGETGDPAGSPSASGPGAVPGGGAFSAAPPGVVGVPADTTPGTAGPGEAPGLNPTNEGMMPSADGTPVVGAPDGDPATPPGTMAPAAEATPLDTGRVVLRRLNRVEYNYTVGDLLGTALTPGDRFPGDDISVEGYDTIGQNLAFTSLHGEQIELAATELVAELLARPVDDPARTRWLGCEVTEDDADECTQQILSPFMLSAYRRPPSPEEVAELVALGAEIRATGGTPEEGLAAALQAVLMSPHFLYRVELDPDPNSAEPHRVSDYELATRLSYFAWASMPDEQLLAAAAGGAFSADASELSRQLDRMLQDPKSDRFLSNFARLWLWTAETAQVAPASELFPSFDDDLRLSMAQEMDLFFRTLVREELPLETLLLADFTFANSRLAEHYALPVVPSAMERVSLVGTERIGLLTQAGFLSMTSYPDRTSPVRRGAWVLEQMLCQPPPPPPPDVIISLQAPTAEEDATLREKLEAHRADPSCATCHSLFDPIGFGLENFDGIGSHRTEDNGRAVDSSGVLPDGSTFNGARELATLLAADERFAGCIAQHLLTYSVGRSFRPTDAKAYSQAVGEQIQAAGGTWRNAVEAVVSSEAFVSRRGEAL